MLQIEIEGECGMYAVDIHEGEILKKNAFCTWQLGPFLQDQDHTPSKTQ